MSGGQEISGYNAHKLRVSMRLSRKTKKDLIFTKNTLSFPKMIAVGAKYGNTTYKNRIELHRVLARIEKAANCQCNMKSGQFS